MAEAGILDDYFSEEQTATQLKLKCTRTLKKWRELRKGPAWVRIGKAVFYRREAITAWLKSQEQQPARSHLAQTKTRRTEQQPATN
jgi:hypothetical protein